METNNSPFLEWQAPARPDHEHSKKWFVVAGGLCVIMIAYGILSSAWSLSLIFAFIPALYYLLRNQSHRKHAIKILETGIDFDGHLHPWGELKEFWILQGPDYYELHISPVKQFKSDIVIMTGDLDPFMVRDALANFLPQSAHQKERLLDAIIRFCKL